MPTTQPSRPASSALRTVLAWTAAVLSPAILFVALQLGQPGPHGGTSVPFYLPPLAMCLPIALLRRRPAPALALMLVGLLVITPGTHPDPWAGAYLDAINYLQRFAVVLAVGYVAAIRPRRFSLLAAGLMAVAQVVTVAAFPGGRDLVNMAIILTLATVTAWVVGQSVRQRRVYAESQRAQAAEQAVQAERLRIARELHDMIAHSIGVIAIQAGVGSRVIDTQPAEARNALSSIEDTSRETLAGLRRMLGALRRGDPESGPAPVDPAPGLADLDTLVARSRDAGVAVEITWTGERAALPPDLDLSAFRIIQESVTNVVRHAHAAACRVVVTQSDEEVSIEVTDDGHGGPAGSGFGIPGMRERVGLLDGEFTAGPRPEGGFRVTARLPVPAGVR